MPKGFLEYNYFKSLAKVHHHFGQRSIIPPLYFKLLFFLVFPLIYFGNQPFLLLLPLPPPPTNREIVTHFWSIFRFYTLNLFFPNAPFFYPLKTLRFSDVFREERKGSLGTNGLKAPQNQWFRFVFRDNYMEILARNGLSYGLQNVFVH